MVTTRRQRVVCCLYDGFSSLDVSLFCAVLSRAGQRWNHRAFDVSLCALGVGEIPGAPHPLVSQGPLAEQSQAEVVFVPGGDGAERAGSDLAFVSEVARLARSAEKVCAAGGGQLVLAQATLLPVTATAADGELAALLEARLGGTAIVRDYHAEGRLAVAAHSLGVLPLALGLVQSALGRSEAEHVATLLGQRQRTLLLGIKP